MSQLQITEMSFISVCETVTDLLLCSFSLFALLLIMVSLMIIRAFNFLRDIT